MSTLYFDCFSGISGDMTIGALLDAGGDWEYLNEELKKLGISSEYMLKREKVIKNGLSGLKFDVEYEESEHHHHYEDIIKLIQNSEVSPKAKEISLNIFQTVAEAEAKIHHVPVNKVHFHEVGAVDSIIDIVGTALLLENLEIDTICSSPIPTGSGMLKIDHGIYPIPAPATLEILKNVPLEKTEETGEMTTPTGAAIIKALSSTFGSMPSMTVKHIGYGAGSRNFSNRPNMLRVMIGN